MDTQFLSERYLDLLVGQSIFLAYTLKMTGQNDELQDRFAMKQIILAETWSQVA